MRILVYVHVYTCNCSQSRINENVYYNIYYSACTRAVKLLFGPLQRCRNYCTATSHLIQDMQLDNELSGAAIHWKASGPEIAALLLLLFIKVGIIFLHVPLSLCRKGFRVFHQLNMPLNIILCILVTCNNYFSFSFKS